MHPARSSRNVPLLAAIAVHWAMPNNRGAWLLVLASTAACGASGNQSGDDAPGASSDSAPNDATPASSAEWQSGTRLRARVLDGGGGASLFSTWFDSERNVECSWAQTAEGAVRCLPRQVSLPYQLYADPSCSTSRVVMESDCAPASPYVTFYESGAINPTVYRLGTVLPMPLPPLFEAGPNGCVATTVTSVSGYHLTNATLVANDLFVVATREREMRGTQLAVDVFATADGARDRRSVLDVARASHCRNMDGHISGEPCLPARSLFAGSLFADATCTTHIATAPGRLQPFLDEPAPLARTRSNEYFEVGAIYDGPLYQQSATCNVFPREQISNAPLWSLGAPVPLSALPAMLTNNEPHAGLHVVAAASASGERLRGLRFFDPTFNGACTVHVAADQQLRCMTGLQGSFERYRDASCTQLILQIYTGNSATFVPPARVVNLGDGACFQTNVATVYPVGAALPANAIGYRRSGQMCELVPADNNYGYFETAGPAPAAASPLVLVRTE